MKNILLIGSSGFIGKHLKKKLKSKYKIFITKKNSQFDIKNYKDLEKNFKDNIDIVINLSGQISNKKEEMYNTIVLGNKNIINIAKKMKKNVKIYFFSSTLIYGFSNKIVDDNFKTSTSSLYTKYKKIAEEEYIKSNINYKILRISNVYDELKEGIIKNILKSASSKKKLLLTNINSRRNYIHISDLTNIISKILSKKLKHKIYNIGNENFSIFSILKTLEIKLKKKTIYHDKKINLKYLCSHRIKKTKILKEINYKPKVGLIKFLLKKIKNEFKFSKK